jgi:hypothetical protein
MGPTWFAGRFPPASAVTALPKATDSTLEGIASSGPREILVYENELEAAHVVLADAQR